MPFIPKVFERDNGRCVYCCRDLKHDFDAFWSTQMDHLVPGGGGDTENIVTACFVCNNLKGSFVPEGSTQKKRIASAKEHIMQRRAEKISDEFSSWVIPNSN